jgi:hypothetical protein
MPSGSNTSIEFHLSTGASKGTIRAVVEAKFKSEKSFFSPSAISDDRLQYEQLIFDLTEVYARKMRKKMIEDLPTSSDMLEVLESQVNTVFEAWSTKRAEFVNEVAEDRAAQEKWQEWIHGELNKLQDYAETEVILAVQ